MTKSSPKALKKVGASLKKAFTPDKPAAGVQSPTSTATRTEVRSPTSTATSTEAYTAHNITVTGGAGKGATHVTINQAKQQNAEAKNAEKAAKGKKKPHPFHDKVRKASPR